jgi:hypothetical protein
MMRHTLPAALLLSLAALPSKALVNLDAGRRLVLGVQLLQDYAVPTDYYYLPTVPRLATRDDGTYELLCLKYVDADGPSGGLFHALIEFSLPAAAVQALEKELIKSVPSGRIVGPVPLMQAVEKGEEGMGSFQIVSATLASRGDGGLTRTLITSGGSPLTPGSKAVVAALLNPKGATLLWDSLNGGATSDVSVAIHAYYEAAVKGYDARVIADVSTVYKHLSEIANTQKEFTRRQIRDVMDDLQRTGTLQVQVLDRTSGLGIKASDMEGILNVVTSKLTELMFDKSAGWSADPQREAAVESNQLLGRQERGWFSSVFGGAEDTKYFTDDQWVLKKRTDIRHNVFSITLAKNSTIKVPLDTAGNLGGFYRSTKDDPRYFRIVNMGDPAYETRTVHFQLDGSYLDAFQDTINFVAVNVRKRYGGDRPDFTRTLRLAADGVKAGRTVQEVVFQRLGDLSDGWTEYEYQVRWSLRDGPTLSVPAEANRWIKSNEAAISLVPPFEKRVIEMDADRQLFHSGGFASALVQFMVQIGGDLKPQRPLTLRAADADPTARVALYHDRDSPIAFSTSWYAANRTVKGKAALLDQDYVFLVPPGASPPAPAPALSSTLPRTDGGKP